MRHTAVLILACATLCLTGCISVIDRPDIPIKKTTTGTYVAKQKRWMGLQCGPVYYERVPTKADETRTALRLPAVWTLGIALPIALVAFACALVLQSPPLTKKCAYVAAIALVAAFGAAAWLLATMYLLIFIPLAILVVVYGYTKMRGKGLRWHKEEMG